MVGEWGRLEAPLVSHCWFGLLSHTWSCRATGREKRGKKRGERREDRGEEREERKEKRGGQRRGEEERREEEVKKRGEEKWRSKMNTTTLQESQ